MASKPLTIEIVYVVMTNDRVDSVFSESWKADVYAEMQTKWQTELLEDYQKATAIHYRVHAHVLDYAGPLLARRGKNFNQDIPNRQQQEEFIAELRAAWEAKRLSAEAST